MSCDLHVSTYTLAWLSHLPGQDLPTCYQVLQGGTPRKEEVEQKLKPYFLEQGQQWPTTTLGEESGHIHITPTTYLKKSTNDINDSNSMI